MFVGKASFKTTVIICRLHGFLPTYESSLVHTESNSVHCVVLYTKSILVLILTSVTNKFDALHADKGHTT